MADFFLGESLVGEGNEIAHVDLIIGSKSGPAGAAFVNALSNNKDGFTTLLAVVTPNLLAKPDTLLFNNDYLREALPAGSKFRDVAGTYYILGDSVDSMPKISRAIDEMFDNAPQPWPCWKPATRNSARTRSARMAGTTNIHRRNFGSRRSRTLKRSR